MNNIVVTDETWKDVKYYLRKDGYANIVKYIEGLQEIIKELRAQVEAEKAQEIEPCRIIKKGRL